MLKTVSKTFTGNGSHVIGSRIRGHVRAIKFTADSNVTNNYDAALTGSVTGIPILTDTDIANNSTVWFHPRALVAEAPDGSAATDSFVDIPLVEEAIQCVIANGGTTGVITVLVIYDADE